MYSVTIPMRLYDEFLEYLEDQGIEVIEAIASYDTYVITVEDEDAELIDDAFDTLIRGERY